MAITSARTPEEYVAQQPPERREALSTLRDVIRRNLPAGYEEGIEFGMISYHVPVERLPKTYNGRPLMYAALANQKHHLSLHLMNVYGDPETGAWFREQWAASGKKLDMGKSCIRIRRLDDVPVDVVGQTIARTPLDRYVAKYESMRGR
ncbi:MAG TPA: DUF1801 domain-containing protein [Candidatus Limnocylindrales bacterium]|nr:DUF1801 domain-containing protein [Candidatus Limnocylindrales bacterium]